MYPAPLPHLGLVLNAGPRTLTASAGSFSLTGVDSGLTYDALGSGGDPAPFPHLGLLLGRPRGIVGAAGSFTVTGKSASLRFFHLTAAAGAFSLTGKSATLKYGHRVICSVGSFALTGKDASLVKVSAGGGGVLPPGPLPHIASLLTGVLGNSIEFPAPLPMLSSLLGGTSVDKNLIANKGTFTLTGKSATLLYGRHLEAAVGTYTFSGAPAERDMELDGGAGSFAVSGVAAQLIRSHPALTAAKGTFAVTGQVAGLRYEQPGVYTMPAIPGQFVLTGVAATLRPTPRLRAETGSFAVGSSSNTDLRYSGELKYGRSRKRRTYARKYLVEVDGQEFLVESEEEARDLLDAALETAKEVVKQVPKKPVRPPRIRVKGPTGPELDGLVDVVSATRNEIRDLFNELQQLAEISRLLQEQDEEEAILALL